MTKEKSDNFEKAVKYAYWLMGRRNHSEKEMRQKIGRNYGPVATDAVIEKLKSQNVINDEKFAGEWTEYRLKQNKSKNFILRELNKKGIIRDMALEVFSKIGINEFQNAYDAVERKMKQYDKLEQFQKKNKIFRFLASKGFDYEIIEQVAQKLLDRGESEEN